VALLHLVGKYPKYAHKQPIIMVGIPMPKPTPIAILSDRLSPLSSLAVVDDRDEEGLVPEGLSVLVLDDEVEIVEKVEVNVSDVEEGLG
jgi:hypothetical protein